MALNEPRAATLQAAGLIRSRANSNNDLPRAPIRAQYGAQLRSLAVNHGQPFPLHIRKLPSQSITVLVFQAGHASSILVTRSTAFALVRRTFAVPELFEHPDDKTPATAPMCAIHQKEDDHDTPSW
jgi:hypothetical protein